MGKLALRLNLQKPKYGCVNRFGILKPGIFIQEGNEAPKKFYNFAEAVELFHKEFDDKEMVEYTKTLKHLKPADSKGLLLNIYKPQ